MLSPERLGWPMKPKSQKLLNDHILIRSLEVFDALFKCPDWDMSLGTVLVQSFCPNGQESFPSRPPSCVSCGSTGFGREENVLPRGRHPESPAIGQMLKYRALVRIKAGRAAHVWWAQTVISQLIWGIRTSNVFEKHFYILALQYSQMLFEFRIQQGTFVSDGEAYSSSPHIPNKSFAFY